MRVTVSPDNLFPYANDLGMYSQLLTIRLYTVELMRMKMSYINGAPTTQLRSCALTVVQI